MAAIVCKHIVEKGEVLLFSHNDDGAMQFLCGRCEPVAENAMVVGVGHVLDWHPDLAALPVVHPGFEAERASARSPWIISKTAEHIDAPASIL